MKRYINASKGQTEKLHDLIMILMRNGIDEHEMFEFFLDQMTSEQCYKMLLQMAHECDIDLSGYDL